MKPRYKIRCPWCFRYMNPYEVLFQCPWHKTALVFAPRKNRQWMARSDYTKAPCPRDGAWCSVRICPGCRALLPHYAGYVVRRCSVSIVGCRGSGKTVYLVGLLKYLLERAGMGRPGLVPMFEDDISYQSFQKLYRQIVVDRELPAATLAAESRDPPPIVVRLYGAPKGKPNGRDPHVPPTLTFYDSPGDLFESFASLEFVRYLANSTSLILTLDVGRLGPGDGRPRSLAAVDDPSQVVEVIARSLRDQLNLGPANRIPKRLAVVLTKCDAALYEKYPRLRPVFAPDGELSDAGQGENPVKVHAEHLAYIHAQCQELLAAWGQHHFLNQVRQDFAAVRFFTCSALGGPDAPRLTPVEPVGVADPLVWSVGGS